MGARTTLVYKVLGSMFLLLGAITLLNVLVVWDAVHVVLWRSLAYGTADLLLAYGCFAKERWVLTAFAVNVAGLAVLLVAQWYAHGFSATALLVALAAGVIAVFAYARRKFLRGTLHGWVLGAGFLLIWAAAFIYTLSTIVAL